MTKMDANDVKALCEAAYDFFKDREREEKAVRAALIETKASVAQAEALRRGSTSWSVSVTDEEVQDAIRAKKHIDPLTNADIDALFDEDESRVKPAVIGQADIENLVIDNEPLVRAMVRRELALVAVEELEQQVANAMNLIRAANTEWLNNAVQVDGNKARKLVSGIADALTGRSAN